MKALFLKKRFTAASLLVFCLNTGISLAQTYTWKNVVVPAGGYVSGIAYSHVQQGLIYMRTDMGGAYRWDNINNVWVPLTDFESDWNLYGIESIAPDPKNAQVVYAAIGQNYGNGNGYVLSSTNQGNSWTQNAIGVIMGGNADGRNAGERLAVDPNLTSKLYFGSRMGGLWVSTNSAATWAKVAGFTATGDSPYGLSFVIFDPHGVTGTASATIYVGVEAMNSGNSNLYRSTNSGSTWTLVTGGPTNMVPPRASLGTDGNLWINYDSGGYGPNNITNGQVWKLNTTTLAWTQETLPGPPANAGGYGGICVDPQNPQHVVVTTLDWWNPDRIWGTINGGSSWATVGNTSGTNQTSNNDNGVSWIYWCTHPNPGGAGWMGDIEIDPFNSNNAIYTTGRGSIARPMSKEPLPPPSPGPSPTTASKKPPSRTLPLPSREGYCSARWGISTECGTTISPNPRPSECTVAQAGTPPPESISRSWTPITWSAWETAFGWRRKGGAIPPITAKLGPRSRRIRAVFPAPAATAKSR